MLNIVIPMAGAGSRFASVGYKEPKPLIDVAGQPMIQRVIRNLTPSQSHRFVFICQSSHLEAFQLRQKLQSWAPECMIVAIDGLTQGAACTVLAAKAHIDNDDGLIIANSDQYVDLDINDYLAAVQGLDGLIMTMRAYDPKWSYVGFDSNGSVNAVVEKKVISDSATVGIYNFAKGQEFVAAAEAMIAANLRTNGEFYVAPAYNQLIEKGARIGVFNIGELGERMHGLGTPEDLRAFLQNPLSAALPS